MAGGNNAGKTMERGKCMRKYYDDYDDGYNDYDDYDEYYDSHIYNGIGRKRHRGSYEDYDHSDEELYVDDQCCMNCHYYNHSCRICTNYTDERTGAERADKYDKPKARKDPDDWCVDWIGRKYD